ncbi:MAG: hypothetical protein ACI4E1_07665 [Lachnospira sp.]
MKRVISVLCISSILIMATLTPISAASIESGNSMVLCYDQMGQKMGAAALSCEFEYSDGNYVVDGDVYTYYHAYLNNSSCIFSDMESGHNSACDYAYASCYYMAIYGASYEFGALEVTCNIYGETEDLGGCIERGYNN